MAFLRLKRNYLYVVESKRTNGTVRQRNLYYLGTVSEPWSLKDLYWLATGRKDWKEGWSSDYSKFQPFPRVREALEPTDRTFDIGKALLTFIKAVPMAPCVVERVIYENTSFPFPKTFQTAFEEYQVFVPILERMKGLLLRAKARGWTDPFGNALKDEQIGRAKSWLDEWLPSVVPKESGHYNTETTSQATVV